MEQLTWLHISDLHRGQQSGSTRWPTARECLIRDLRKMAQDLGPPDAILSTGDLAFSGQRDEYDAVDETLTQLCQAVTHHSNRDIPESPIIVPVPGNHDLQRVHADDELHTILDSYHQNVNLRRQVFNREHPLHHRLRSAFSEYESWMQRSIVPAWTQATDSGYLTWQPGTLPGDMRLSLCIKGWRLGVVGMNSAFLQLGGGRYSGKLAVEPEQLAEPDVPKLCAEHDACLLLMHHPPDWLHSRSRELFEQYLYPSNSFTACMFGHMHRNRALSLRYGAGTGRQLWQGTSLFGLEHFSDDLSTDMEHREVGYAWYRLTRTSPVSGYLERWARRGVIRDDGTLDIDRDLSSPDYPWKIDIPLSHRSSSMPISKATPQGSPVSNPFRPAGRVHDPKEFVGRKRQLYELQDDIRKGVSRALIGEAQIGKSSLLAMLRAQAPMAGLRIEQFIHLDLQVISDAADFFCALCMAVDIPTCSGSTLKRALTGKRYVVCLDEVEKLRSEKFSVEVREHLRGLADGMDAPLTLVLASRQPLEDLFPDAPGMLSPLHLLCTPLHVPPFSLEECRELILSRLLRTSIRFSETQIANIYERSCGNPGSILKEASLDFADTYGG